MFTGYDRSCHSSTADEGRCSTSRRAGSLGSPPNSPAAPERSTRRPHRSCRPCCRAMSRPLGIEPSSARWASAQCHACRCRSRLTPLGLPPRRPALEGWCGGGRGTASPPRRLAHDRLPTANSLASTHWFLGALAPRTQRHVPCQQLGAAARRLTRPETPWSARRGTREKPWPFECQSAEGVIPGQVSQIEQHDKKITYL